MISYKKGFEIYEYPARTTYNHIRFIHRRATGSNTGLSVLLKDTSTRAGIEPPTPWLKDRPANHWPTVVLLGLGKDCGLGQNNYNGGRYSSAEVTQQISHSWPLVSRGSQTAVSRVKVGCFNIRPIRLEGGGGELLCVRAPTEDRWFHPPAPVVHVGVVGLTPNGSVGVWMIR